MTTSQLKRVHCRIGGRVQGVWFRKSTQQTARDLRLTGWVRNLTDGRVELVAEGPAGAVDDFLAWLETGPPGAQVEDVRVETEEPRSRNSDFEVLY